MASVTTYGCLIYYYSVPKNCLSFSSKLLVSTFQSASQKVARDDICSS